MTRRDAFFLPVLLPLTPLALAYQGGKKRLSPHETVSVDLGGHKVTIVYGRPYLKGRQVGQEVAPNGQVWRLGADEATTLTLGAKARLGSVELPAGSYGLFAIPGPEQWTLIVNGVADQWGAFNYDATKDLGRFSVPVHKTDAPVEQFTITLTPDNNKAARLTMAWGGQSVTTSIQTS